uniref:Uncharacterized protein n=1 Tax=Arundo donax TaxID=35708 RepID=A0A0A9AI93_ARUDO
MTPWRAASLEPALPEQLYPRWTSPHSRRSPSLTFSALSTSSTCSRTSSSILTSAASHPHLARSSSCSEIAAHLG